MRGNSLLIRLVLCLAFILGANSAAVAFVAGDFVVSSEELDLGTVRIIPSNTDGTTLNFTIGVTGGPVPSANGEAAGIIVATNASWLTVTPPENPAPDAAAIGAPLAALIPVSAKVTFNMSEGTWEGHIYIYSTLDPATAPVDVLVHVNVEHAIGDALTVSPTIINAVVSAEGAGRQTFPVNIINADPEQTADYVWSATKDAEWIELSESTGTGDRKDDEAITVTINPDKLMLVGNDAATGFAATGTVTFLSNLNDTTANPVTLTINVKLMQSTALSATPGQLYWSVVMTEEGEALTFEPQSIQVFAGAAGWSATYSSSLMAVTAFDAAGDELGVLASSTAYGHLEVTPVASALQYRGYGRHEGSITVTDRLNQFNRQIPVVIDILRPGEIATIPLQSPEFYQINSSYVMIEATDASQLAFQMQVPSSSTQSVFVLIELPEMLPGKVYALTTKVAGGLAVAYQNGILVTGANNYSYADGPVPSVPIGPFQLQGLYGTAIFTMKTGSSLSSSSEVQRVQVNIRTLDGSWRVTESYNGQSYTYTDPYYQLALAQVAGRSTYSGIWGPSSVTVTPGDGVQYLYRLTFSEAFGEVMLNYVYEILSLTGNTMKGRYSFGWDGGSSPWETFQAQRVIGPFQ